MIYQVKGKFISEGKDFLVLEVGGIGLKISTTLNTISEINSKGDVILYTYLHVREDALDLYGSRKVRLLDTYFYENVYNVTHYFCSVYSFFIDSDSEVIKETVPK